MGILNRNRDEATETIIPESQRPSVGEGGSGVDFGFSTPSDFDTSTGDTTPSGKETYIDDEGVERYVHNNRKKRADAGTGRTRSTSRKPRKLPKPHEKAGAGATILYGGVGAVLTGTGIAPAAGFSMQGLADEAGPEIAAWAEKRSPRFYQFLESLSDTAGIGKYVAGPVSAEAYLRMERARPALGPVVTSIHGPEIEAPMNDLVASYDSWKAMQAEQVSEVDPRMNGFADAE